MTDRERLTAVWPLFGLNIKTPRLEMRLSYGNDLSDIAAAARHIRRPEEPQFQKAWMYDPSPVMERELFRRYWKNLAEFTPEKWRLSLIAYLNNQPVGMQDLWAEGFLTNRTVITGSWLTLDHQSKGLGTEMRAGALKLAFAVLGATEAKTDFIEGNNKSEAISKKLGYIREKVGESERDGQKVAKYYMTLTREAWEKQHPEDYIVSGVENCLELFGLNS
jgi:RimJ/RimL family protein N-acetyltransferase